MVTVLEPRGSQPRALHLWASMEPPEPELIRQSWQAVSRSPLEHGAVLFTR